MARLKTVFKPGTIVTIFQRPVTGEAREGDARLIKCLRAGEPGRPVERWVVSFLEEPGARYEREISTELKVHSRGEHLT